MKISRKSAKKNGENKKFRDFWLKISAVLGLCGSERAQKKLQNEPLDVQKLDDTAENGPSESSKSCLILVHVDICGVGPDKISIKLHSSSRGTEELRKNR